MAKTKVHGEYLDPSVISGQTQVTAVGADSVLILDATDNALKKALLSDVIETVDGGAPTFTTATISGSNPVLNIARTSNYTYKIGSLANDTFAIQSNETTDSSYVSLIEIDSFAHQGSSPAIKVDSSGNVGIGGSPGAKLDVNTGTVNTLAHFHSTDDNAFIELKDDDTTGYIGVQNDYLYIGGAPSTNTQNINIHKTTGRVGIGTTGPESLLHVDDNFDGPLVTIHQTGGASSNYRGLDVETSSTGTSVQRWFNAGSELMRVGGNGNVGIGTSNPSKKLEISGGDFGFNLGTGSLGNKYIVVNSGQGNDGGFVIQRENTNKWQQTINASDDDNLWFYSYGTNNSVLTLDRSSGAVNMQNQPVAIYTHSTNSEAGAYNYTWAGTGAQTITMKPQTAVVNRGSMYNTSNGRFTAPVDGIYRYAIHGNLYTSGLNASSYFLVRVLKSGNHYVYHYEDNGTNAANGWIYMNYAGLISLTAGQYIEMQLTGQNLSSTQGFGWDISNYTHYEFQLLY